MPLVLVALRISSTCADYMSVLEARKERKTGAQSAATLPPDEANHQSDPKPSNLTAFSTLSRGNALVNMSAGMSAVGIKYGETSPSST